MGYEGKVIKRLDIAEMKYADDRARFVVIKLADGTTISIRPAMGNALIVNKTQVYLR